MHLTKNKKNQRGTLMLKWKFKFKVNPDCTRNPGTRVPARESHTRPGYIKIYTRILPGLIMIMWYMSRNLCVFCVCIRYQSMLSFEVTYAYLANGEDEANQQYKFGIYRQPWPLNMSRVFLPQPTSHNQCSLAPELLSPPLLTAHAVWEIQRPRDNDTVWWTLFSDVSEFAGD